MRRGRPQGHFLTAGRRATEGAPHRFQDETLPDPVSKRILTGGPGPAGRRLLVLVAHEAHRELAAETAVRARARPRHDGHRSADVQVVRAGPRKDRLVARLSTEPVDDRPDIEPERPVTKLELHVARVFGVNLAVGQDGYSGA